jgi:peptide/nickel transport system permease protein
MTIFIIRRLMQSIAVVAVMSFLVFGGVNLVGDPVDMMLSDDADQQERERVIRSMGLDKPWYVQYGLFVTNAMQGDLGKSFVYGEEALGIIVQRMPATFELALAALLLAILIGIPLGVFAGLKPEARSSKIILTGSILGFSLPTFWVGLMFIMVFAVMLGWLPSTGRGETVPIFGIGVSFLTIDGLAHLILPAVNLALYKISLVIRLTRAGTREIVHQDYIIFARAKGLSTKRVIFVHLMKNIMIPVVTVLGLEFGGLIAFSIVTETVFAWPGMGKLIIDSIQNLDRPVIVAYLMIVVLVFIVINLVVDVFYSVLDPRIRIQDFKA